MEIGLIFPSNIFRHLDKLTYDHYGMPLKELGTSRPFDAFMAIDSFMRSLPLEGHGRVEKLGRFNLTAKQDGNEAVYNSMMNMLDEAQNNFNTGVTIVIGVFYFKPWILRPKFSFLVKV